MYSACIGDICKLVQQNERTYLGGVAGKNAKSTRRGKEKTNSNLNQTTTSPTAPSSASQPSTQPRWSSPPYFQMRSEAK